MAHVFRVGAVVLASVLAIAIIALCVVGGAYALARPYVSTRGQVTTFAGAPYARRCPMDGTATVATFCNPTRIVYDSASGDLYVADVRAHEIRRVDQRGSVSTFSGRDYKVSNGLRNCQYVNGPPAKARFCELTDLALDPATRTFYVVDAGTIRAISSSGFVSSLAGKENPSGSFDPSYATCKPARILCFVWSVAVDPRDHSVWATDNSAVVRIDRHGGQTLVAGSTAAPSRDCLEKDGVGSSAVICAGSTIRYDQYDGRMYLADGYHLLTVSTDGRVARYAGLAYPPSSQEMTDAGDLGCRYWDGPRLLAAFCGVWIPAFASNGDIFVTDTGNSSVRKIGASGFVSTVAGHYYVVPGMSSGCYGIDGVGTDAKFCGPLGMAIDMRDHVLFVADAGGGTIRKITLPP